MRIADLGRDLRVLEEARALQSEPFAKDDLACSAAVGVCGIEPSKAQPAGMIEQLQGPFFTVAGAAQVRRRSNSAEIATAEHNPVDVARAQHPATPQR